MMPAKAEWTTVVRQVAPPQASLASLWRRLPDRAPRALLEGVRWQGQSWLYLGWDAVRHWTRADVPHLRREILNGSSRSSAVPLDWLSAVLGVFGHDALQTMEGGAADGDRRLASRRGGGPDSALFLPGRVLLWRPGGPAYLAANLPLTGGSAVSADALLDEAERLTAQAGDEAEDEGEDGAGVAAQAAPAARSNWSVSGYTHAVDAVKAAIRSGSLSKAVLSLRLTVAYQGPAFPVFGRLRRSNPSSLTYLVDWASWALVGASPEPLVLKQGNRVFMRPLAGTRRRGATAEEDGRLREELRSSRKDAAEHRIAVDQAAADLAQVCLPGSVEAPDLLTLEGWPQVWHLASALEGTMAPGRDAFDLLAACSPAATVVGAPRPEALALIRRLEPGPRGLYAGAIALLTPQGDMQSHIILRSLLLRGGSGIVQAGAGIVLESDPVEEYRECLGKAGAALAALGVREP